MRLTDPWVRLRIVALLALGVLALGTAGYVWVEGWPLLDAFYMTLITLTTVGFGEVRPLDGTGKIITIVIIATGVGLVGTAISFVTQLIQEGGLGERGRRRRMQGRIDDLRDHFVVCAYGRVGRTVVRELESERVPYVVIDSLEDIEEDLIRDGVPNIIGDPTDEAVLRQAGTDRARGLISAVDDDADNVYITLTARSLNPDLLIVARAADESTARHLYRAGANRVVSPYVTSGRDMAHMALHRRVVDSLSVERGSLPALVVEELEVEAGSTLLGRSLDSACRDTTPLMIRRSNGDVITNPGPDLTLEEGDLLVLVGEPDSLRALETD